MLRANQRQFKLRRNALAITFALWDGENALEAMASQNNLSVACLQLRPFNAHVKINGEEKTR
jgi:hypothetical protein